MFEIFAEPGAAGWYAEAFVKVGNRRLLIYRTPNDNYQDADAAETAAAEWVLGALTAFFTFHMATLEDSYDEADEVYAEGSFDDDEPTAHLGDYLGDEDDEVEEIDFEALTARQLIAWAEENGVDTQGASTKGKLVEVLTAAVS